MPVLRKNTTFARDSFARNFSRHGRTWESVEASSAMHNSHRAYSCFLIDAIAFAKYCGAGCKRE